MDDWTQADPELIAELEKAAAVMAEEGAPAPVPAVTRDQKVRALVGDLGWLEYAIADYVAKWGTQWTGQPYMGEFGPNLAGLPTAVANMAMTVIRKNLEPLAEAPQPKVLTTATLVHEALPHGGFRGHVIVDDNSIWDLPANSRVAVVALGPPVPEAPEGGSDAG